MEKNQRFPILEFDPDVDAIIRPHHLVDKMEISERCVMTFFADEMEKFLKKYPNKVIGMFKCDAFKLPIYEVEIQGRKVTLLQAMVGGPVAARQIEDLTQRGCQKFMICGDCGVLDKEIVAGHLIIPTSAIRDEGTSYHYLPPSREVEMDLEVLTVIKEVLSQNHVPYLTTKTWTTDAFFRETRAKTQKRKNEGCLTVEMEAAAYMAVAKFNHIKLGQILYAGDALDQNMWDRRKWQDQMNSRERLLDLTIQCCLQL